MPYREEERSVTNQPELDKQSGSPPPSRSHDVWALRHAKHVGLDCEWKPNYRSWTTSKVAILQLCSGTRCLVLQLLYVDRVPASVRSFLADPNVWIVGIGVGEDAAKLTAILVPVLSACVMNHIAVSFTHAGWKSCTCFR
nr:unnamed protein product [Digitaria exilis]